MIAPPTMRRGGRVNPFTQSAQYDSLLPEVGDGAGDFGDRATEAVDRDNDDGVAGAGVVEYRRQPGPRRLSRSRQFVGKHPTSFNTGRGERVDVLAGGADPCVGQDCRHSDDRLIACRRQGFETRGDPLRRKCSHIARTPPTPLTDPPDQPRHLRDQIRSVPRGNPVSTAGPGHRRR
jgi:hypothetical protein